LAVSVTLAAMPIPMRLAMMTLKCGPFMGTSHAGSLMPAMAGGII
jgi:hypothetical protein